MESMKSLNTSLPRSPRRRRSNPPPEELIQTFKAAALSVTNLYKTAAADQRRAREAGYQDALDDILAFLDKENLGLDDGEGWRIRQWATERLDGSPLPHGSSDSDDDRGETMKRARSSSPDIQRRTSHEPDPPKQDTPADPPNQATTSTVSPTSTISQNDPSSRTSEVFSFRAAHPYPQDTEMQTLDGSNNTPPNSEIHSAGQIPASNSAVRLEVVPRGSRASNRSTRHNNKTTSQTRSLGSGAGSKRSFRFGEYEFDLGPPGDPPAGGGKRGRFN